MGKWVIVPNNKQRLVKTHIIDEDTKKKICRCHVDMAGIHRSISQAWDKFRAGDIKTREDIYEKYGKIIKKQEQEAEATARLIVKAPQMEKVLKEIYEVANVSDGAEFYAILAKKGLG